MKRIIAAFLLLAAIQSCTNPEHFAKGKHQLEMQGYTDVRSTGWTSYCCAESDDYTEGFVARDKEGNLVKGCICSGWLKGITIRFE